MKKENAVEKEELQLKRARPPFCVRLIYVTLFSLTLGNQTQCRQHVPGFIFFSRP